MLVGWLEMSKENQIASWREFMLFWVGFSIVVIGVVCIMLTVSGVLVDVLGNRCWYPILSPLIGISQPPTPAQIGTAQYSYYCYDPTVAVIRFVFNLLAELIVIGAGLYMMLNGKKH
jgi:hypothetical protein